MSRVLRSLMIFAAITCCVHEIAEGQTIRRVLSHVFCHKCRRTQCGCAQPVVVAPQAACLPPASQTVGSPISQSCTKTCTTVHPVVETRYRQEQFMTCRTECRTAVRQEAYCETVPTTCVENITRDEGCYQMVWVPKPVTRQVAKTVYQQRTAYRNVPYQYTVQVPQMNTRVVPVQSVRYVQRTKTFVEPMQPVGCAPMIAPQQVFMPTTQTAALPAPITAPSCAAPGVSPPRVGGVPSAHRGTPWTQVPQRAAATQSNIQGTNYMSVASNPPRLQSTPAPATPTAAAVWQARR